MMTGQLVSVHLVKECPRCRRLGDIYADEDGFFAIVWRGPARGGNIGGHDIDRTLSLSQITAPTFGCGYDHPKYCVRVVQ